MVDFRHLYTNQPRSTYKAVSILDDLPYLYFLFTQKHCLAEIERVQTCHTKYFNLYWDEDLGQTVSDTDVARGIFVCNVLPSHDVGSPHPRRLKIELK